MRHPGAGWWHGARLLCCASTPPLTPPPQIFTFYKAQGKKTGASLVEEDKVELAKELNALKAAAILDEQTKDLAATEAEKLKKLVEGVDFDSEDLYREKVSVIK